MGGLLLKDIYQMIRYCKIFLVIAALFTVLAFSGNGNLFFLLFLGIIGGMLPMNLLAYDERDNWDIYANTLPYSRAQIVSVKYLIGLIIGAGLIILAAVLSVIMSDFRGLIWDLLLLLLTLNLLVTALVLPLTFKFGVAKGRIFYYVLLGICFAVSFALAELKKSMYIAFSVDFTMSNMVIVVIAIYLLSWLLSVQFYKKRQF